MALWLIQGVFFQNRSNLDIGYQNGIGESVMIRTDLCRFTYAGMIGLDPVSNEGNLIGMLQDYYGHSILFDVVVSDEEVGFTKRYVDRDDFITYTFRVKDGQTWVGEYAGSDVGTGISRCILTSVEDSFLLPESILALLGRDVAHSKSKRRS